MLVNFGLAFLNIAYADSLSKSIGASEAHSYLREAQQINTDTASYNNNQATAFIKDYAAYRFGSDSPENVQKAMTFLNGQAIGSREDQRHLEELANDFLSGRFGALETTGAGKTISREAQAMQVEQSPLQAEAHSMAGKAVGITRDISEQPFPQSNQGKVEEPSRREVESKVEARQEFFDQERSGQGRIQTNIIGMAGQGIGKIDHAIGKLTGKPDRPQQDVMGIGAPDRPGAPPIPTPGTVEVELSPAPATFEEAVKKEQEK